jgi:hypothetical protein
MQRRKKSSARIDLNPGDLIRWSLGWDPYCLVLHPDIKEANTCPVGYRTCKRGAKENALGSQQLGLVISLDRAWARGPNVPVCALVWVRGGLMGWCRAQELRACDPR